MMSGFGKGAKKGDTNLQLSFMEMTIKYFMFNSLFSCVLPKNKKKTKTKTKTWQRQRKSRMVSKNRQKNTVNIIVQ